MKIDLRAKQHDLGEIVGYAYRLYARNFPSFFLIAAVTIPVQMLIGVLQDRISDKATAQAATSPLQFLSALVTIVATCALIRAVDDACSGTRPEPGHALDTVFERLWAIFGTLFLTVALVVASLPASPVLALYWLFNRKATIDGERNWWLVLIPGALAIYLAIRWQLTQQAIIIDGKRNWSALDQSAAIVHHTWWRVFGILLVIGLIQLGPLLMVGAATALPPLPAAAITSIVIALVLPFPVTAQTLLYYDLKARKQSHDSPDRVAPAGPDVQGQGS